MPLRSAATSAGFLINGSGCSVVASNHADFCASLSSSSNQRPLVVTGQFRGDTYDLSAVRFNASLSDDEGAALLRFVDALRSDGVMLCSKHPRKIPRLPKKIKNWMKASCNVA